MAKIKVIDFLKNVELNRRKLVDATGSSKLDSLDNVTNTAVEKLSQVEKEKHEVRFFDADGTQIGDSIWVEDGDSVTPPPNPNIDPERLVFDEWYSVIGRFDNIIHDVDYGAHYNCKDDCSYLFLSLSESTGLSLLLDLYLYSSKNLGNKITIDWGDGTPQEDLGDDQINYSSVNKRFSHTYEKYGNYIISITPNFKMNLNQSISSSGAPQYTYIPPYYYISTSTGSGSSIKTIFDYGSYSNLKTKSQKIDSALTKIYAPIISGAYLCIPAFSNIKYAVFNAAYNEYVMNGSYLGSIYNIVLPNKWNLAVSGGGSLKLYNTKRIIFDAKTNFKHSYSLSISAVGMDKLMLPRVYNDTNIPSTYYSFNPGSNMKGQCNKIISYENSNNFESSYATTKSLELYGDHITTMSGYTDLQNLKYPDSVKTISKFNYCDIEYFKVPDKCSVDIGTFSYCGQLKYLQLYKNFNTSLNLRNSLLLTNTCLIDILNNVAELDTPQTITFGNKLGLQFLKVKLNNGLYELTDDENALNYIEALQQKGWTVSLNAYN